MIELTNMFSIPFMTVLVLSLTSLISAQSTSAADVFIAGDSSIKFALNVADNSDDLYFSLSGPSIQSWIAVGMGTNVMQNSLMIILYSSSSGLNVTISPRLSYGHVEPFYTSNITVEALDGTGISGAIMTGNGVCRNCRSWSGGSIDIMSAVQSMIYAVGPSGAIYSNSLSADIKRHSAYGVFTMNLLKATGPGWLPSNLTADSGATQISETTDHDFSAALHAVIMVLAFVGILPLGIALLRLKGWVRWHGINQALAFAGAIIGAGIGIYTGTMYNRSMHWNSTHQILGLIIMFAMAVQLVMGYIHHRRYQKTLQTTKLAPIHVWLGRVVIISGIINGFLGFPLALNANYNWVLLGVVLFLALTFTIVMIWNGLRKRRSAKLGTTRGELLNTNRGSADADLGSAHSIDLQRIDRDVPPNYGRIPGQGSSGR